MVLESAPEVISVRVYSCLRNNMLTENDTVLEVNGHASSCLAVFMMLPWWMSYMDVPKL